MSVSDCRNWRIDFIRIRRVDVPNFVHCFILTNSLHEVHIKYEFSCDYMQSTFDNRNGCCLKTYSKSLYEKVQTFEIFKRQKKRAWIKKICRSYSKKNQKHWCLFNSYYTWNKITVKTVNVIKAVGKWHKPYQALVEAFKKRCKYQHHWWTVTVEDKLFLFCKTVTTGKPIVYQKQVLL